MAKKNRRKNREDAPAARRVGPSPTPRRRLLGGLSILGVILASGFAVYYARSDRFYSPHYAFGSLKGYNVLLVTLDTTRADHLPAYGYRGVSTPGLDRIAETSLIFDDAIAHVPLTLPSHASILTGLLPIAHGVRDNEGFRLDSKIATLPEILRDHGYATAAFVSAFVLDSRWGLNRGFDVYFDKFNQYQEVNRDEVQRRAEETESEVERWLPTLQGKPFFCWVHFYDPHEPYDPPEPYRARYAANRYDGEIAYMDQSIGKLLAKLAELRLSDRTMVIVTGDHGEGLGEHGELTHAMFLYRTTLHVPLLVQIPGGRQKRIRGVVRHIDLAPTILDLLGVEPASGMQGASLVPVIDGTEREDRTAYSESLYAQFHFGWSPLTSLTARKYDLIQSPKPELFNHVDDPGQLRNLFGAKSSVAETMKEQLDEVVARYGRHDLEGPKAMDPDTEAKLRSLGYLGSSVQPTAESLKIDPKDKPQVVAAVHEGFSALGRRDFQRALQLVVPVTQSDPGIVDAHYIAGTAFANLQMNDQALDELFKVLAVKPEHTMSLAAVGSVYENKGDLKEAERWYSKVLQYDQDPGLTMVKLANVYRLMHEPRKADEYFSKAIAPINRSLETTNDPKPRARLYSIRAEMYFGAGRIAEAEADLQAAIALTPSEPVLHFNLAQIYERKNDVAGAILNYREEARVAPPGVDATMNLGMLYFRVQRFEDAATCFETLQRVAPQDPRSGLLLAEAYLRMGRNLDQALRLAQQGLVQMGEAAEIYLLIAAIEQKLGRDQDAALAFAKARALQGR
jgi:arylsulfatase A-like enzyme/tetratricopeptide (TPR) repeat protein